ncbi:hypothetical protein GCM10027445_52400 [Amycolatopsis endophytica]
MLGQVRQGRLQHRHRGPELRVESPPQYGEVEVGERAGTLGAGECDHQSVDGREAGGQLGDSRRVVAVHAVGDEFRRGVGHRGDPGGVATRDVHGVAAGREPPRGGQADARSATDDECGPGCVQGRCSYESERFGSILRLAGR